MALERKGGLKCVCVSDEQTMHAAVSFAGILHITLPYLLVVLTGHHTDDHKVLVELGCAATLTTAYSPQLFNKIVPREPGKKPTVVFIVCGGFKVWLDSMVEYRHIVESLSQDTTWDILCNGERWKIAR